MAIEHRGVLLRDEVAGFLKLLEADPPPDWSDLEPSVAREMFDSWDAMHLPAAEVARVTDQTLGGVATRLYHPDPVKKLPCVVVYHGGGWVLGGLSTHDTLCRQLATQSGCAVIAVDYPLSPESRHDATFAACVDAYQGVVEASQTLSIDPERIAVGGDSAGGNLAAAVAMHRRDNDASMPKLQMLLYPVVSPNFQTESYERFAEGFGLTRRAMKFFWQSYLGDAAAGRYADLMQNDLSNLPPTLLVLAGVDVLYSEGDRFGDELRRQGVSVQRIEVPDTVHGFVHLGGLFPHGAETLRSVAMQVRRSLEPATA